ncbi:MAG TPA: hypothetical protein PKM25_02065 [Candidatus Ozemobacteraceae bacterium]|nr:hypothetical protein [Candidatus Ozemobacteraceae bacterium]
MSFTHRARRGFIAFYSFILLLILGIFGISYWGVSRLSTGAIIQEAGRIRARNLAQAGVEKVMINILNQYRLGNHNLEYPGKFSRERTDKEYNVEFGDGSYRVESVQPYSMPGNSKVMRQMPYVQRQTVTGTYDVWKIVVIGEIPDGSARARVETLVKIIRQFARY